MLQFYMTFSVQHKQQVDCVLSLPLHRY